MKLSKRRLEFLEALADLVKQKGAPVHYVDVSEKMAVSKWTAYDMMRELAEDGLVEASYSVNPSGSPGRSQVLFSPTRKGFDLIESARAKHRPPQQPAVRAKEDDEWQRVKDDLLNAIMASSKESGHTIDLTKAKYNSSPLAYCAALLSLLIIEAKHKGLDLVALSSILDVGTDKGISLLMFAGLLMGGLLVRGTLKLLPDAEQLMHSLSRHIEQLEQSKEDELLKFVRAIVGKASPA